MIVLPRIESSVVEVDLFCFFSTGLSVNNMPSNPMGFGFFESISSDSGLFSSGSFKDGVSSSIASG